MRCGLEIMNKSRLVTAYQQPLRHPRQRRHDENVDVSQGGIILKFELPTKVLYLPMKLKPNVKKRINDAKIEQAHLRVVLLCVHTGDHTKRRKEPELEATFALILHPGILKELLLSQTSLASMEAPSPRGLSCEFAVYQCAVPGASLRPPCEISAHNPAKMTMCPYH